MSSLSGMRIIKTIPRLLLSFSVTALCLILVPMTRMSGFRTIRDSARLSEGSKRTLASGGRIFQQLLSVSNSTIRLPVTYRHEPLVERTLTSLNGRTFLDLGANQGYYSCLLSKNFQLLIAAEPAPYNVRVMERVFRLAGIRPIVLPYAVTDLDGETILFFSPSSSGHQVDFKDGTQNPLLGGIPVRTVTVASLVNRFGGVDLAKVDTEGAEWLVLKGAEAVTSRIERWLIELHDLGRKKELEDWMIQHGYTCRWIDLIHLYGWKTKTNIPRP